MACSASAWKIRHYHYCVYQYYDLLCRNRYIYTHLCTIRFIIISLMLSGEPIRELESILLQCDGNMFVKFDVLSFILTTIFIIETADCRSTVANSQNPLCNGLDCSLPEEQGTPTDPVPATTTGRSQNNMPLRIYIDKGSSSNGGNQLTPPQIQTTTSPWCTNKQSCSEPCVFGYVLDSNGCETCTCKPSPCQGRVCPGRMKCRVRKIVTTCLYPPCYPRLDCVDPPRHCILPHHDGFCDMEYRKFFYNAISGRCEPFIHRGCGGNMNRFLTMDECQRVCTAHTGATQFCTGIEICNKSCPFGYNELTGCFLCQCRQDPCQTKYCGRGTVCRTLFHSCQPETICNPSAACVAPKGLCLLPQDKGSCTTNNQTRYSFNPETRSCTPFIYSGCGGNLNNFVSPEECRRVCIPPTTTSPPTTTTKKPSTTTSAKPTTKSKATLKPTTKKTTATTTKKPTTTPKCPSITGCKLICNFGFLNDTKGCPRCACAPDPCGKVKCSQGQVCRTRKQCPDGKPCYYSGTCVDPKELCKKKAKDGDCKQKEKHFFYNSEKKKCEEYQACPGIYGNRFSTLAECLRVCGKDSNTIPKATTQSPRTTTAKGACAVKCKNQCPYGHKIVNNCPLQGCPCLPSPCIGRLCGTNLLCRTYRANDCYAGVEYCPTATYACIRPTICKLAKPDRILGSHCNKKLLRWYYDATRQFCVPFIYPGCGGSYARNIFHVPDDCENVCVKTYRKCDEKNCSNSCTYGYKNGSDGCLTCTCAPNPCTEETTCKADERCRVKTTDCDKEYKNCTLTPECINAADVCKKPMKKGNCNQRLLRYYFDTRQKSCQNFRYSGCGGNKNNFLSRGECRKACES